MQGRRENTGGGKKRRLQKSAGCRSIKHPVNIYAAFRCAVEFDRFKGTGQSANTRSVVTLCIGAQLIKSFQYGQGKSGIIDVIGKYIQVYLFIQMRLQFF